MTSAAWTRFYRPAQISSLHNSSVRRTLEHYLADGRIPQVLLFSGPKGTGKTSASRLIAAVLNDTQNESVVRSVYFDHKNPNQPLHDVSESEITTAIIQGKSTVVNELDAASNRGIDDVRRLHERVHTPPPQALMSVYILDEVHMFTKDAFNALLKLLEEPPRHAVFILATTERDKVPDTVISRSQELLFSKATQEDLLEALTEIVKAEKLDLSQTALTLIAEAADGSFRDAVKLLQHIATSHTTSEDEISSILSLTQVSELSSVISSVLKKDAPAVIQFFETLRARSVHPQRFYTRLIEYLHHEMVLGYRGSSTLPVKASRFLLKELQTIPSIDYAPLPFLPLELCLLDIIARASSKSDPNSSNPPVKTPAKHMSSVKEESIGKVTQKSPKKGIAMNQDEVQFETEETLHSTDEDTGNATLAVEHWQDLTSQAAEHNFSLAALLKSAQPELVTKTRIRIKVYYQFHKEQLSQPKFKSILAKILHSICGGSVSIEFFVDQTPQEANLQEVSTPPLQELAAAALM